MGADDEMVPYTAGRIAFNRLDMVDEAEEVGFDPDLLAQLAQGRLGERLAGLNEAAGQAVAPRHRRPGPRRDEDAAVAEHRHRGREEGAGRIEAVGSRNRSERHGRMTTTPAVLEGGDDVGVLAGAERRKAAPGRSREGDAAQLLDAAPQREDGERLAVDASG